MSRAERDSYEERFWAKVEITGFCWNWLAARSKGYGRYTIPATAERKQFGAMSHRHSYELLVGPIPEGMQIDHLCRNRSCVNPDHLEPVTGGENNLRSYSPTGVNGRKKFCVHGHEYTPENTRMDAKGRVCRSCRKNASMKRRKNYQGETV